MRYFYVVCPIGKDPAFLEKSVLLRELSLPFGLEPFFPFEGRSHFDLSQTKQDILKAAFVFADLSYERPSCYFELGLAQALGAKCFLVAEAGTAIHQLNHSEAVRTYENLNGYRSEIANALFETTSAVLPFGVAGAVLAT